MNIQTTTTPATSRGTMACIRSAADAFLSKLDPAATSWTFQTFDDNYDRRRGDLARTINGTLAEVWPDLVHLSAQGAGVFVTINETDGKARKATNIMRVRALFVDLDGAPLDPVRAWEEPHAIIETSPARWHAYWRVDGIPLDEFRDRQKVLIEKFGADEAVCDLPRVMRLPGFPHQKVDTKKGLTGSPFMVREIETGAFPNAFSLAEIDERLAEIRKAPALKIDTGPKPTITDDKRTLDEVAEALDYIDPDAGGRQAWLEVLMGIHDEFGAAGLDLADTWSKRGAKYRPGDVADRFKSFNPGGGVGIAAVFQYAKAGGCDLAALARKHKPKKTRTRAAKVEGSTYRHKSLDLVRDDKDQPFWNMANATEILTHHPAWRGVLAFNTFTGRRVVRKPLPFGNGGGYRDVNDDDYSQAVAWFNRNGFPRASDTIAAPALRAACRQNPVDPLAEFLDGLQWDGTKRIGRWLIDYMGAEDTEFVREAGARWLISAVARGLQPGCKVDTMLVLEGAQGVRKSSGVAALAGAEWFGDSLPDMGSKDAMEYLAGLWICEVAELVAARRDIDAVKAFLSRQHDQFRWSYGREVEKRPRRCVFIGTTNDDAYLRDETGNRRFWPVKVEAVDVDRIKADRHQLWAEAVTLYRRGEPWWLSPEVEAVARVEQGARLDVDPWHDDVVQFVEKLDTVAPRQIINEALGKIPADITRRDSNRVVGILKSLGWTKDGKVTGGAFKDAPRYRRPA